MPMKFNNSFPLWQKGRFLGFLEKSGSAEHCPVLGGELSPCVYEASLPSVGIQEIDQSNRLLCKFKLEFGQQGCTLNPCLHSFWRILCSQFINYCYLSWGLIGFSRKAWGIVHPKLTKTIFLRQRNDTSRYLIVGKKHYFKNVLKVLENIFQD